MKTTGTLATSKGITEETVRSCGKRKRWDLSPAEEAIGWLLAEKLGLTDGIGGMEWWHRCLDGCVGEGALRLLYQTCPEVRESLQHHLDDPSRSPLSDAERAKLAAVLRLPEMGASGA